VGKETARRESIMHTYTKPVVGLSNIRSAVFLELFDDYKDKLDQAGYSHHTARFHLHSIAHFGVWLEFEDVGLETVDVETVFAFKRHRPNCRCPGVSRNRGRHVVSCVRLFVRHLRERGIVDNVEETANPGLLVREFLGWMSAHRGVVETTLSSYQLYVTQLVELLGDDPQTYTARGLRNFVSKRYRHYGRNSIRMVLAAVRMFLRYLAIEGRCRAGLEQALPSPANWSQQSLPRGLSAEDVERVLAQCPSTPRGIRDRAILLLLVRLGLRAGDVSGLRLSDLCFESATISVSGKSGRQVRLPLPQDVGDALLAYLRTGRPQMKSEYVFLRSKAPYMPFASGHAVTHVARSTLKRAGVVPPTRGSHVFRHTAACQLLRQGVGLEGIADVLRHRSIDTTALYAKVDQHLLTQVAQPWPEVTPC
jgi:site-specific recombinase XerD